jgi:N-acetylglucosaminyldiphosphoundecaprenol N-acetyl-beta-D-mannosaminyltransferase
MNNKTTDTVALSGQGNLRVDVQGSIRVVGTPAKLSGDVSRWLICEAKAAAGAGETMVIDMSLTIGAEADGLGALLEARRLVLAEGLWIWLAGMSNPVRRVLQFSAMADLFRIAATPAAAIQFTTASASMMARSKAQPISRSHSAVATQPVARAS